jgi:hypothetical protein
VHYTTQYWLESFSREDVIIVKMEYAFYTWERIIDFEVDTNSQCLNIDDA